MTTALALPPLPALVHGEVRHARNGPVDHRFTHRVYQWLVDVDDLPTWGGVWRWVSRFRSADHLGSPHRSIRANLESLLAEHDIDLAGGRIVMLANARTFGHVFDPLSVFWCLGPDGECRAVVAEVHNTYGERHAYVLPPTALDRASVDKGFYVSPFYDVSGSYDLRMRLEPQRVSTEIVLHREGATAFAASFHGRPEPATRRALARTLLQRPLMTHRISVLIRLHGVWLWLRRLPIVARPRHVPPEGVR